MKTKIFQIDGKQGKEIDTPKYFSHKIREDIVNKVLEAKKSKQPYGSNPVAGLQASASGKLIHRRHVWKSQYGRGMSRIPRKKMSRRGSQFNWVGATSPNTRGGRRAHPPKAISMKNTLSINKKEYDLALLSALSATADKDYITKKYDSLDGVKRDGPLIVDSKLSSLKAKELKSSLKEILGDLFDVAVQKKAIRAGKGKLRGRKYKKNAGLLLVVGNDEKLKSSSFEAVRVGELGVTDLARGGLGRLTVYTEKAIEELNKRFSVK
jgi:large subunit ribosomal protein L4e|tara:strand:- start:24158 stop:24955 length:798 start_codon:yes stop_codon:yes gene_type:complete